MNPACLLRNTACSWGPLVVGMLLLATTLPGTAGQTNAVLAPYANDLVVARDKQLTPFDSGVFLQAPLVVLYYSAKWCPDCRIFSPKLVAAYNQQPAAGRRFEVLLLSRDKTEQGMLDYMTSEHMPWPALAFDKTAAAADLQKLYSGHGIPCLTVINSQGTVVLQSKSDQDGEDVLKQLLQLVRPKL